MFSDRDANDFEAAIEEALDALAAEFEAEAGRAAFDAARFEPMDDEPTEADWDALARSLAE